MITLRRDEARQHHARGKHEAWLTFPPLGDPDPMSGGLASVEHLNEDRLAPGSTIASQPPHDCEILTYVREGALAFQDSTGRSRVIQAGEFHRVAPGATVRHRESNASRAEAAHAFQIWLRPPPGGLEPGQDQMRFSAAERRGWLFLVASPDGRRGSLRLQTDVFVYSALLETGQHLVHELPSGRSVWLHVVDGSVTLDDVVLTTGDGVGISAERAVSLTARTATEVLLLEFADAEARSRPDGVEVAPAPAADPGAIDRKTERASLLRARGGEDRGGVLPRARPRATRRRSLRRRTTARRGRLRPQGAALAELQRRSGRCARAGLPWSESEQAEPAGISAVDELPRVQHRVHLMLHDVDAQPR